MNAGMMHLRVQVQQLRHNQVGHVVVHRAAHADDALRSTYGPGGGLGLPSAERQCCVLLLWLCGGPAEHERCCAKRWSAVRDGGEDQGAEEACMGLKKAEDF